MDLKETEILGDGIAEHWYYQSKAIMMTELIGDSGKNKILDVGAGSAFFSKYLLQNSKAIECVCIDTSYETGFTEQIDGKSISYSTEFIENGSNVVLMMDVLEHIDDDVAFLKSYVDKIARGTKFLITVPAFQFMWSSHDVFLEHKRRHTLASLESLVTRSGLVVEKQFYFYGLVLPIAMLTRFIDKLVSRGKPAQSKLRIHHPIVNAVLKKLCIFELAFMQFNKIAGLSVICYAVKP